MLIEIAETHPPAFGKKVAKVIAADRQEFEIWPEKLADLKIGGQYDVDVAEREFQGRTIKKITRAKPASPARTNGHAAPAIAGGEPEFVGRALAALIAADEVKNDKRQLYQATVMLRGLWGATFGSRRGNGGSP